MLSFLVLLFLSHLAAPPNCQVKTAIILCLRTIFSRLSVLHPFGPPIPSSVVISVRVGAITSPVYIKHFSGSVPRDEYQCQSITRILLRSPVSRLPHFILFRLFSNSFSYVTHSYFLEGTIPFVASRPLNVLSLIWPSMPPLPTLCSSYSHPFA